MAISCNNQIFSLHTKHSTYQMKVDRDFLIHTYYGPYVGDSDMSYLARCIDRGFSGNPDGITDKGYSLDTQLLEYPSYGTGDFRNDCLRVAYADGSQVTDLKYVSHEIKEGKYGLEGLPAMYQGEENVQTLEVVLQDVYKKLEVILYYGVFENLDVITRACKIVNKGEDKVNLLRAYSMCLDFNNKDMDFVHFYGRHAMERIMERTPLHHGIQSVGSRRGFSSHQHNPFVVLCAHDAGEDHGNCYGASFVYSGNFAAEAEVTQADCTRMTMGIHDAQFQFELQPQESFTAPEVMLSFSSEGLGTLSRNYHKAIRYHICRGKYKTARRPILINNWEATYFNFNTEKLLDIVREAKKLGIEMLVMDDGWFGKRNSDNCSLGDWTVNEEKITGGLKHLVDEVNKIGLKFGIWMEPEMISPDSELYAAHPDWAIQIPGREATQSRQQYVLDISRPEIRDYVYDCISKVLHSANIEYVKWDMNRQLCDMGSIWLGKENQQELFHRYVLGVYELQERLVTEFPDLLLENCSGGGARFDPGMLYYSPQIWCSDDTDAIERLRIQEGTALVYPLSAMGAHVSVCPNHTVGRVTPFATRGHVALAGTFGYELDITKLSEEDRKMVQEQTKMYHKYHDLVREGDYYRIASYSENHYYDCWAVVAKDKSEVLLTYVQVMAAANMHSRKLRLDGFDPAASYRLESTGAVYTGEMLMKAGFLFKDFWGDFQSRLYHFVRV